MKGNQEPMLYTTNATVAALNHVPGFDPLKFLRRTISRKTGEDVMRLDLRYKKLWFRLACPTGRLKLNALRITEKMAIFEAKVYRDREDAEPLSSYVANCTLDATPGGLYVEAAQEEALDTALSNAGFGIQFADVGSESEEYGSEVPVGAKVEIAKPVQVKTADAKPVQTKVEVAEPVQKQPETVKTAPQEPVKADPLDAIMADGYARSRTGHGRSCGKAQDCCAGIRTACADPGRAAAECHCAGAGTSRRCIYSKQPCGGDPPADDLRAGAERHR